MDKKEHKKINAYQSLSNVSFCDFPFPLMRLAGYQGKFQNVFITSLLSFMKSKERKTLYSW